MDHVSTLLTAAAALLTAITGFVSAGVAAIVTLRRRGQDNSAIAAAIAVAIAQHDEQERQRQKQNLATDEEGDPT